MQVNFCLAEINETANINLSIQLMKDKDILLIKYLQMLIKFLIKNYFSHLNNIIKKLSEIIIHPFKDKKIT